MKKLFSLFLLLAAVNVYAVDEEFARNPDALSVSFFGGYHGAKIESWNNAGMWGFGIDYIRNLPGNTWTNLGAELKLTTITMQTLSDFGVRLGYGVLLFNMWRTGLGARFDVNLQNTAAAVFGKYHLIPYLTNSVLFPMNGFSAVEIFLDLGMPVSIDEKKVKVQGVEARAGLSWLFKVGK